MYECLVCVVGSGQWAHFMTDFFVNGFFSGYRQVLWHQVLYPFVIFSSHLFLYVLLIIYLTTPSVYSLICVGWKGDSGQWIGKDMKGSGRCQPLRGDVLCAVRTRPPSCSNGTGNCFIERLYLSCIMWYEATHLLMEDMLKERMWNVFTLFVISASRRILAARVICLRSKKWDWKTKSSERNWGNILGIGSAVWLCKLPPLPF